MKFLCKYLGGSHLYSLNTPNSDLDERGVYLTPDLSSFFGFKKDESKVKTSDEVDYSFYEFKYFLQLLKKTNTNSLECLFAPRESFSEYSEVFGLLQRNRNHFVNSGKLLASLRGYTHNESRLALGERTGKLGGKRKACLDEYGFSPKNVSHMVRLAYCAGTYFETGHYPVDLLGTPVHALCLELKTNPENFTVEQVTKLCKEQVDLVEGLVDKQGFTFDDEAASRLLLEAYQELLNTP
jgi:predicted nucleotidyltransferase